MFRMTYMICLRPFLGLCCSVSTAGVICRRAPCALYSVSVCRDIPLPQVSWELIWFLHELIKERAPCKHSWIDGGLRGPCYWFNITLPLNIQDTQAQAKRSWSCVFTQCLFWHQHRRDLCLLCFTLKSRNKTSIYPNIRETHLLLQKHFLLLLDWTWGFVKVWARSIVSLCHVPPYIPAFHQLHWKLTPLFFFPSLLKWNHRNIEWSISN